MQEGVSYLACAQIPCVFANIVRGGPGLGTIQPSQSDYNQATKGGGHGDYNLIVLAPNSVQEMVDHCYLAFELADKYRSPAMLLSDGAIGQMMEKVTLPAPLEYKPDKPWATVGKPKTRERNILTSLYIRSETMEEKNIELQAKFKLMRENEVRFDEYRMDDAEIVITAFGLTSRVAKKAVEIGRDAGLKLGMFRPITVWPFPFDRVHEIAERDRVRLFCSIEMNAGQMVKDIELAVCGKKPVRFYGRMGGIVPTPQEIFDVVKQYGEEI
jgi:2-oxoglutarate ferredoxin oxidoreductase subunit alpha